MLVPDDPALCFVPYPPVTVAEAAAGPLRGLTLAVKDIFDVAGFPTGCGSPHMLALSGVKTAHAPVVARLLGAGARFVGKTVTDELAYSLNGKNAHFGTPVNGAAPDRIPGGSSSGSASAVSNGLADIGLGSDTGGSVRGPASYCGLFGLRPTHGVIDIAGTMPLAPSFDTVGWFARDVGVMTAVGDVLLPEDTGAPPVGAVLAADVLDQLEAVVRDAVEPTLRGVAAALGSAAPVEPLPGPGLDTLYWTFRRCQAAEAWHAHGGFILRFRPPLGPGVRERFAFAAALDPADLAADSAVRGAFRHALTTWLGGRVLVMPTMPDTAPLLSTPEDALDAFRNRALRLTCIAGLAGLPQLTLPLASREGAPIGVSLLAGPGTDRALLRLAARVLERLEREQT